MVDAFLKDFQPPGWEGAPATTRSLAISLNATRKCLARIVPWTLTDNGGIEDLRRITGLMRLREPQTGLPENIRQLAL